MASYVLLVGNNDAHFLLIKALLGDAFELIRARTLGEGMQLASDLHFDLIILELNLPDSVGYATFSTMHAASPGTPIVIVSDLEQSELALKALSNGAVEFIPASWLPHYPLARVVHNAVWQQRAEEEIRAAERYAHAAAHSLSPHIALLDDVGTILSVNEAWRRFGQANGLIEPEFCVGINYFEVCENSTGDGTGLAHAAAAGIRQVLRGDRGDFFLEYPCHSLSEQRWFIMRATPMISEGNSRIAVCHENITPRRR